MNVLLSSARYADPGARHAQDAAFAAALAAEGCTVRWIVPVPARGHAPPAPDGVRVVPVQSPVPPFRRVQDRLLDGLTDQTVSIEIRRELADVFHLLDYGGTTSVNSTWLAPRLGARSVVSASALPTLCHRGDLVHGSGAPCTEWRDALRCARCCLLPTPRGLSRLGSLLGRALAAVHSPVDPFPRLLDFQSRLELVVGGLVVADQITVSTESDRELIASLGIRRESIEVLPSPTVREWLALYERVLGGDRVEQPAERGE